MKRRTFIQNGFAVASGLPFVDFNSLGWHDTEIEHLVILHTNDTHSRIDPFPDDGGRNAGMGGAARRAVIINEVREAHPNVLLFDSGDIFQGTPYFNLFKGELEIKLMSEMGYDAATIGNHDFDAGIEGLHAQLPHSNFPFIISNYEMKDTIMNGHYCHSTTL